MARRAGRAAVALRTRATRCCDAARDQLPDIPAIANALATLRALAAAFAGRVEALHVDLADLRGYHYHNGPIFSVFTAGVANAIGNGGRYDGVGKAFGRSRPATGFTLDLRQLNAVLARCVTFDRDRQARMTRFPRCTPCEARCASTTTSRSRLSSD